VCTSTDGTYGGNVCQPGHLGIDSVVVGFYRGKDLIYAARVRAGFVPRTRREVFEKIRHLKIAKCPFGNLLEAEPGRWGQGLTVEKMKECVWVLCRIRHRNHNVECRTMPYAFWAPHFTVGLLAVCASVALIFIGIVRCPKGCAEMTTADRLA